MKIVKSLKKPEFGKIGKLPRRPSALIRLAIQDLCKAEKSPKYKVDMDHWFIRRENAPCKVCLAGSVVAFSLNAAFEDIWALEEHLAFYALDVFRKGNIGEAFYWLGFKLPYHFKEKVEITPYDVNPRKFKSDMRSLASALAKEGY